MNMETNKSSDEEEYRPAEYDSSSAFEATPAETVAATNSTSSKASNILEHLKRKNIIIAVVVLVAVFCVYKIVDVLFNSGTAHSRHKASPPVQTSAVKPKVQATSLSPPAESTVTDNRTHSQVAINSVANRLDLLEQNTYTEQTNLERLNTQVNELQSSLSTIDTKLANLTSSMQILANEFTRQQEALKAKEEAKKKAMRPVKVVPKPVYYVKAMVPGRAWLMTQGGRTMTVSLGNELPGYGTVQVIDPTQGILITSSGAIIGYSPSDS